MCIQVKKYSTHADEAEDCLQISDLTKVQNRFFWLHTNYDSRVYLELSLNVTSGYD